MEKCIYLMEEQINDCYAFLGFNRKDAFEMNEAELDEAEGELKRYFEWVEHPECIQYIPKHIETGKLIW